MIRIGITGADGFLGWHLRVFLRAFPGIAVVPAGRDVFANPEALRRFAAAVDVIVHLAGANRGSDEEIRAINTTLAARLVRACEEAGAGPHVLFANSTHYKRASAYGESKRIAAQLFAEWAEKSKARFTNLVMPHVFGEGGRPFYNSAVATFCHQLAHGEEPHIIDDGELELIHAQRVAEQIKSAIDNASAGEIRLQGTAIRVSAVLAQLREMAMGGRAEYPESAE